MGFLEAYLDASFRTAEDGSKLFFPWGIFGRGYVVPSEEDFQRLRRGIKFSLIVPPSFLLVAFVWKGVTGAAMVGFLLVVAWACWVRFACRRLDVTNERPSFGENLASQARVYSTRKLWLLEIGALVTVGVAFVDLLRDTGNWLRDLALVVPLGFCALVIARMLIEKRREAESFPRPPPPDTPPSPAPTSKSTERS